MRVAPSWPYTIELQTCMLHGCMGEASYMRTISLFKRQAVRRTCRCKRRRGAEVGLRTSMTMPSLVVWGRSLPASSRTLEKERSWYDEKLLKPQRAGHATEQEEFI